MRNLRKNKKAIMFAVVLLAVAVIIYVLLWSNIYLPKNVRYFRYLIQDIAPSKDRYEPILLEVFNFYEKGFVRMYSLKPKYSDIYDLGIMANKKILSSKYKFKGKLSLEFIVGDKVASHVIISDLQSRTYFVDATEGYDLAWSKEITLTSFEIPFLGRHKKNIGIKLTVLDPDAELLLLKDDIKLFVRVSSTP